MATRLVLILIGALQALSAGAAHADGYKMRAREHYETMALSGISPTKTARYFGFSNTINIWYEKPFHYAFGLAGSPLFATLELQGPDQPQATGKRIRLVHLGLEGKLFVWPESWGAFTRLGLYHAQLQSGGSLGTINGKSYLLGIGYEWNLAGIGIAPELAWRQGLLKGDVHFIGQAPAIGVHFYKLI